MRDPGKFGNSWRSAFATTNSDGGMPGRMVRSLYLKQIPNQLGGDDGEVLEQALGDNAGLNEGMISVHFAPDMVSVIVRLAMKVLIAVAVAQRSNILHPEMICECADLVHRLFKAVLDLEAQAIETDDIDGAQRRVRARQDARPPLWGG